MPSPKLLICLVLVIVCIPRRLNLVFVESKCDLFKGSWVLDESQKVYYDASSCPFIHPGLNCQKNGRPDHLYLKYRWNPVQCQLSRFGGLNFLQKFRGKKVMFVGDSLGSNQWQSLACMLHSAAPEAKYSFTTRGQLVVLFFPEYEMHVMYLKNGFLVDLVGGSGGKVLKLDTMSRTQLWNGVDVLIFDTYHWWMHTGKAKIWNSYQLGGNVIKNMDIMEAFKAALTTWARWIDSNVDPTKTRVFFQGISAVHYDGNTWSEPAVQNCSSQTKPIDGADYPGQHYPGEIVIKEVINDMKTPVYLLDLALLTQLRKDGHPGMYADASLDCSHWCLAGVPDTWNEILYTILLDS